MLPKEKLLASLVQGRGKAGFKEEDQFIFHNLFFVTLLSTFQNGILFAITVYYFVFFSPLEYSFWTFSFRLLVRFVNHQEILVKSK